MNFTELKILKANKAGNEQRETPSWLNRGTPCLVAVPAGKKI